MVQVRRLIVRLCHYAPAFSKLGWDKVNTKCASGLYIWQLIWCSFNSCGGLRLQWGFSLASQSRAGCKDFRCIRTEWGNVHANCCYLVLISLTSCSITETLTLFTTSLFVEDGGSVTEIGQDTKFLALHLRELEYYYQHLKQVACWSEEGSRLKTSIIPSLQRCCPSLYQFNFFFPSLCLPF